MGTRFRTRWAAAAVGAVMLLAGCGSSAPSRAASSPSATPPSVSGTAVVNGVAPGTPGPAAGSGSATAATAVAAATAPTAIAPPSPVQTSSPGPTQNCLSGTVSVIYPAADNPVRSVCVHLGTAVNIELVAIRGTTWSAAASSDPSVASVTDQVATGGTRHDSVRLLRPGMVTLTSVSSYAPDPHGPPSKEWALTLTVVP